MDGSRFSAITSPSCPSSICVPILSSFVQPVPSVISEGAPEFRNEFPLSEQSRQEFEWLTRRERLLNTVCSLPVLPRLAVIENFHGELKLFPHCSRTPRLGSFTREKFEGSAEEPTVNEESRVCEREMRGARRDA